MSEATETPDTEVDGDEQAHVDRANIAASYRWRMLFVAVFCFGFALWCAYDGSIAYPAKRERQLIFIDLIEEGREEQWEDIALEKGWPLEPPVEFDDETGLPKKIYQRNDFLVQYMMGGIITLIGIPFLYIFVSTRGKWIEMDDDGLSTSWGARCDFEDITTFDKTKWYKKGIAYVNYEREGEKGRITLDDVKYDREPTEIFVRDVELEIEEDQVIGKRATFEEEVDADGDADESAEDSAEPREGEGE